MTSIVNKHIHGVMNQQLLKVNGRYYFFSLIHWLILVIIFYYSLSFSKIYFLWYFFNLPKSLGTLVIHYTNILPFNFKICNLQSSTFKKIEYDKKCMSLLLHYQILVFNILKTSSLGFVNYSLQNKKMALFLISIEQINE